MENSRDIDRLRGFVVNPEAVARIAEEALRDDAWWIAARSGRYFQGPTIWADCVRGRVPLRPLLIRAGALRGPDGEI
jgi:hypothetical protein